MDVDSRIIGNAKIHQILFTWLSRNVYPRVTAADVTYFLFYLLHSQSNLSSIETHAIFSSSSHAKVYKQYIYIHDNAYRISHIAYRIRSRNRSRSSHSYIYNSLTVSTR